MVKNITYEKVDLIPKKLKESVLYISLKYGVAVHKCFCGCREKVVMPIKPNKAYWWELSFNDNKVTVYGSIGNYQSCRSHYKITNNQVLFMEKV